MENKTAIPHVYTAIGDVSEMLSIEGISKSHKNSQQGYSFRGIDDVYNALAPLLTKAKLCILPTVLDRIVVERESKSGGALFYITVKMDFAFVSAKDGSSHHVVMFGEAMDSGDKATNKAMSAAYKYACMQAFCIPTQGDNDADKTTYEVQATTSVATPNKITANRMLTDEQEEIINLGKKAFKGVQLPFLAWLYTSFLTNDVTKLSKEQLAKAKGYLTDAIIARDQDQQP